MKKKWVVRLRWVPVVALALWVALDGIEFLAQAMGGAARRTEVWESTGGPTLKQVVETRLTGLMTEDPESLEQLRAQALVYLSYRSGDLGEEQQEELEEDCRRTGVQAGPYCSAILRTEYRERGEGSVGRREKRRRVLRWLDAIRRADVAALTRVPEDELYLAFKRLTAVTAVRNLLRKLEKTPGCPSSALLTGLGLYMERGFPKEEFKKASQELYTRSRQCRMDASVAHASYRLSLIHIWDGKFWEAEKVLREIHDRPESNDFRLRIAYWRHFIAGQLQDERTRVEMRDWLAREYPLSLHGLLVNSPGFVDRDHPVLFRSRVRSTSNPAVRATEMLQALGAMEASADVLLPALEDSTKSELSFRLYLAALISNSGDLRRAFPFTASLFKENPMLLTRSTLELLYPKATLAMVRTQSGNIDPFLILSLIRQESAFNTRARSPTGALGLMQIQPSTARYLDRRVSKKKLAEPETNVRLGVKYFHKLLARYDQDVELALAAYNAGPERLSEWQRRYPVQDRLLFLDLLPIRETREYVASIARNYYWYSRLYVEETRANEALRKIAGGTNGATPLPSPRFQLLESR